MGMGPCKNCGKDLPWTGVVCPWCGAKRDKQSEGIILLVAVCLTIFLVWFCCGGGCIGCINNRTENQKNWRAEKNRNGHALPVMKDVPPWKVPKHEILRHLSPGERGRVHYELEVLLDLNQSSLVANSKTLTEADVVNLVKSLARDRTPVVGYVLVATSGSRQVAQFRMVSKRLL